MAKIKVVKNISDRDFTGFFPKIEKRNDDIQTPPHYAEAIVNYLKPTGKVLEPCKGDGNFLRVLPEGTEWCEIKEGKDFFDYQGKVDWIITNPPYSKWRYFLGKSLEVSDNVVFFTILSHLFFAARLRLLEEHNFGIKQIIHMHRPHKKDGWIWSGFSFGIIHLKRNYKGKVTMGRLQVENTYLDDNRWAKGKVLENNNWNHLIKAEA